MHEAMHGFHLMEREGSNSREEILLEYPWASTLSQLSTNLIKLVIGSTAWSVAWTGTKGLIRSPLKPPNKTQVEGLYKLLYSLVSYENYSESNLWRVTIIHHQCWLPIRIGASIFSLFPINVIVYCHWYMVIKIKPTALLCLWNSASVHITHMPPAFWLIVLLKSFKSPGPTWY